MIILYLTLAIEITLTSQNKNDWRQILRKCLRYYRISLCMKSPFGFLVIIMIVKSSINRETYWSNTVNAGYIHNVALRFD